MNTSNPWRALWAMLVGFFMTLIDSTAVSVANPSIMAGMHADYESVIWVTSAYGLGFAVPLLVAGRLGDRFGPKNLYLVGLAIFTAASLWCGLSGSIEMLVAARVVQGLGAALLTPQTLLVITRIFPAERRGVVTSVWGAAVGVATLAGPLVGGVLIDQLGWQCIFFVNVPIGIIGFGLAVWLMPVLPTNRRRFDVLGVVLSGTALFLIVFGLQEAQPNHWAPWIWAMLAAGLVMMAAFVYWQFVNKSEPLVPLRVFGDRNFSVSSLGVGVIAFVWTAMVLPVMFFAQVACGLSATRAALLTAPMALTTAVLAPIVGRIVDRSHPRRVIGFGFAVLAISLTWLSIEMTAATPIWRLLLPFTGIGVGMAFITSPLAATATRNLPPELAGAGSGVFTATRQMGSVLGSASMAAFMTWQLNRHMPPGFADATYGRGGAGQSASLSTSLRVPYAAAMFQPMLLVAFVALLGVVGALFLVRSQRSRQTTATAFTDPRNATNPRSLSKELPEFAENGHRGQQLASVGIDFVQPASDTGRIAQDHVLKTIVGLGPDPISDLSDVADEHELFDKLEQDRGRKLPRGDSIRGRSPRRTRTGHTTRRHPATMKPAPSRARGKGSHNRANGRASTMRRPWPPQRRRPLRLLNKDAADDV
jgi:EmrB/QacA subfamily drug resistance transporter